MRPFRYLRDPLFLFCFVLYFVNRFALKHVFPVGFFHDHLNDLICLPFWLPLLLWITRILRLRKTDAPPSALEIFLPTAVWSLLFELVLPTLSHRFTADPWDITCYIAGALAARTFWNWSYLA